jgi:hypothetical protein
MIAKYRRRKPDMRPEHDFFALGLLWKNGRPGGLWVPLEHVQEESDDLLQGLVLSCLRTGKVVSTFPENTLGTWLSPNP